MDTNEKKSTKHTDAGEISFLKELPEIVRARLGRGATLRGLGVEQINPNPNPADLIRHYQRYLDSMSLRTRWDGLNPEAIRRACVKLMDAL